MPRILVAEDERATRLTVKKLLEKDGHEVVEAGDGSTAYELAISEAPDVGVLDVRMPGMDSFEVLRRLEQHPDTEHMPIVMLTSVPIEKGEPTAASFGASHYLPKPLDPKTLRMAVRSAVRQAETLGDDTKLDDPVERGIGASSSAIPYTCRSIWQPTRAPIRDSQKARSGWGTRRSTKSWGGGIPEESLCLIEGQSSAGKSVLCQHLAYWALRKGRSVVYITFEDIPRA